MNQLPQSRPPSNYPSNLSSIKKKTRRSKNDPSGRDFQCKVCLKSYLGSSSLYLHLKSKHPEEFSQERLKLQRSKMNSSVLFRRRPLLKFKLNLHLLKLIQQQKLSLQLSMDFMKHILFYVKTIQK